MTALDPITKRMFPTLAAYARKMRWLGFLAVAVIVYTIGFHNGLLLGSYRGRVADESMTTWGREFHQFKEDYLKHHAKALMITKAQARVVVQQKEDLREEKP